MTLNNDLLAKIVSIADVSIDTYLAFKNIGAIPKKIKLIDSIFKTKIDKFCNIRVHYNSIYNKIYSNMIPLCGIHTDIKIKINFQITDRIQLQIDVIKALHIISHDKYSFLILKNTHTLRKNNYNIYTGEEII